MKIGELWGAIPSNMEVTIVDAEDRTLFIGMRENSNVLNLWNHSVKDFYEMKEKSNSLLVKVDGVENNDTYKGHF